MARTQSPHSASAQFLSTLKQLFLKPHSKTAQAWGYAAFGKVVEGMDVVAAIKGCAYW